jgi:hypothetical protein
MVAPPTEATMRLEERQPGDGRSEQAMTPERAKRAPQGGPSVASRREAESLSGGLLCDRSAEFERPVFFPATRYQSDNGAKERHGCDFLGHGDPHHCQGAVSITSPPGCPQHMIDAKGYFVCAPVRRGHGALGTTGQDGVRSTPPHLINPHPGGPRAVWRIRSDRVSVWAEELREDGS